MAKRYVSCCKGQTGYITDPLVSPCKAQTNPTLQGREGIVIVKTKQALLIGHYPENVQPGQAATTVEKLADYLIGVGY